MNTPVAPLLVIFNPSAARAPLVWPGIRERLTRNSIPFDLHQTRHAGDAQERTRAALREGYATVAAVGGDGTLSEVAAGFFERCDELRDEELPQAVNPSAALAVLPAGTGDDFARGAGGGRRAVLDEWVQKLISHILRRAGESGAQLSAGENTGGRRLEGKVEEDEEGDGKRAGTEPSVESTTRRVDVLLGSVDGGARRFISINALTLGIGAEVAARVAAQGGRLRRLPGEARFAWAAVGALAAWRERRVRLRVDGGAWRECRTNLIAVTNGAYAGGGMQFAPGARIDDGRLDVVTACGITRAGIVRELARIHRGGHLANPRVRVEGGTRVRIEVMDGGALGLEADGDVRGATPAEVRVMPRALRVVA